MQKLKLIVDTDIGDDIDDAFALALLFQMPEVEILGVMTVYRNAFLRAKIASRLAQLCGQNIPVYVGEDTPLNDPIEGFAFEKADADGKPLIGHYDDSMRHAPIARGNAADFILQQAERFPGQITVLALGPMTNLARAYFKAPETFRKIGRIHMMGGDAFYPTREWNLRCDTDAAAAIFASGVPITMIGYNVTNACRFNEADIAFIDTLRSAGNRLLAAMMHTWMENNHFQKPPVMHDGLAAACLAENFCDFVSLPIVLQMDEMRGRTVVAPEKHMQATQMRVAVSVDRDAFIAFLKDRLGRAEQILIDREEHYERTGQGARAGGGHS